MLHQQWSSGLFFAHLWWGSEGIGTALVSVVHELLQVLQILKQQSKPELIGVVTVPIASSTSPRSNLLLWVQAVGSQAPDHAWTTGIQRSL